MSEYQYYEFVAIDRPLTGVERSRLRAISSRATISATRFQNHYEWGDLKADPVQLLVRYFDVHLYVANWGSRRLMLRLPKTRVNVSAIKRYFPRGSDSTARLVGSHLVLDFTLSSDECDGDDSMLEESISSFVPLRAELLLGDMLPAYLAWLSAVESRFVDDDDREPTVPPNLAQLSAAQRALASFLRLNPDLVDAAAAASRPATSGDTALREWVASLTPAEKERWLLRALDEPDVPLGTELRRRFDARRGRTKSPRDGAGRTARELLAVVNSIARSREERETTRLEAIRAEAEKERRRHLADLAADLTGSWRALEELLTTSAYDAAIRLATDLREIADRDGASADFAARFDVMRSRQKRRRGFFARWNGQLARRES